MTLAATIESGLNDAGTAVAVIGNPDRGTEAVVDYANDPFAAAVGLARTRLIGATLAAVLDRVSDASQREQLVTALRSGTPVQTDLSLLVGKTERWLGLRLSFPPPGESGARYAILIGRDITQSRRNATQEDKTQQLLAQIFMRVNAPVTIVGRSGEMVMSNTAYRQLTGFTNEELKQMRVQDLTPAHLMDVAARARDTQFGDGQPYEMDFETLVKGGHRVAVRLTSVLLSDVEQSYRVVTLLPRMVSSSGDYPGQAAIVEACLNPDSGELRTISLDALRKSFGSDWQRIAPRAMLRAEQAIRKRLRPGDLVSRPNDSNFLVWFNSENQSVTAGLLEMIVRDVRMTFLTDFGEEMAAYVSASLIPMGETSAPVQAVDPQYTRMHKSAGDVGRSVAPPTPPPIAGRR